jgi:DNA-binding protein H-NS
MATLMKIDFDSMSTDELWSLHKQLISTLARRIMAEKIKLEGRLRRLETPLDAISLHRPRRPYPKVLPKYQNPKNPSEKWSGRGKQPHWVRAQLKSGKKLDRLLIVR